MELEKGLKIVTNRQHLYLKNSTEALKQDHIAIIEFRSSKMVISLCQAHLSNLIAAKKHMNFKMDRSKNVV